MLKKPSPKQVSLLCVDIGTSSVKSCVFVEQEDQLILKGQSHMEQLPESIQSGNIIQLGQVISAVQETVRKSENMARVSPHHVIFGVSGELVKGQTIALEHERNDSSRPIDAQELKTIIYKLQWQAFEEIRRQVSDEMSLPEMDLKLMNASIISIRVDGEAVQDPRGYTGSVVQMEIFNCFAPIQNFGQLQSVAVELPYHELKGVFIQSFAVCHALALKNTLESAIVIDIGAGTTDICVMSNGKIIGNRSFGLGGNSLTKRISYELSTSFQEAESIKMGYCSKTLEKRSQKVIEEALEPDIDIWLSSLEFSLKELPIKKLPEKILLCGKASSMAEFQSALEKHDWTHHFPIEKGMQVRQLDYEDILDGDIDHDAFDLEYLPLIAVAYTAHDLLYNNSSVEGILNAVLEGGAA
jgi:cell division protein FtsA